MMTENPTYEYLLQRVRELEQAEAGRQKKLNAIKSSEQVFTAIINAFTESVFLMKPDGTVIALNNTTAQRLGKTVEEIRGRIIYDFIPEEVAKRRRAFVSQAVHEGRSIRFEDDRQGRRILNTIYPIKDSKGRVKSCVIAGYDITEQKQMEINLRETQRLLQDTQAITHVGGWQYEVATKRLTWTDEIYRIYGVDRDYDPNNIDRNLGFYMPAHAKVLERAFKNAVEKGEPYDLELEFTRATGEAIWVRTISKPVIENGQVVRVTGNLMDISERKRSEIKLNANRQFLNDVLESIQEGISVLDRDYRIIFVNGIMRNWYNDAMPLEGRLCFEVYHNRKSPCEQCPTSRCLKSGKIESHEVPGPKNSPIESVEVFSHPFKDPHSGHIEGVVQFVRDITDIKKAEREKAQLESQHHQLQKAESLGRMASAIAHSFNNLLHGISGNIELELEDKADSPSSRKYLSAALNQARKAAEISRMMQTYLGNNPTGKFIPIDLGEVCRQIEPILRQDMPSNMAMETSCEVPGPLIRADKYQIQQIVASLVTNALEASGGNQGTIKLAVKNVDATNINDFYRFPINWVPQVHEYGCIEVIDYGCGIKNEDMEKIFDPFYSTKFIGRGLGLSAVLGIVRASNGVVTVESKRGQGSVFRVFIPLLQKKDPKN